MAECTTSMLGVTVEVKEGVGHRLDVAVGSEVGEASGVAVGSFVRWCSGTGEGLGMLRVLIV